MPLSQSEIRSCLEDLLKEISGPCPISNILDGLESIALNHEDDAIKEYKFYRAAYWSMLLKELAGAGSHIRRIELTQKQFLQLNATGRIQKGSGSPNAT